VTHMRMSSLRLLTAPLALLQRFLRSLGWCDVGHGPDELNAAGWISRWVSPDAKLFESAAVHWKAIVDVKRRRVLRDAVIELFEEESVIGMNSLKHHVQCGFVTY